MGVQIDQARKNRVVVSKLQTFDVLRFCHGPDRNDAAVSNQDAGIRLQRVSEAGKNPAAFDKQVTR